jgi:hypothetical protein
LQTSKNEILATFKAKTKGDMLPAPAWKWLSMEHQWYFILHLGRSNWRFVCHYA